MNLAACSRTAPHADGDDRERGERARQSHRASMARRERVAECESTAPRRAMRANYFAALTSPAT